MALYGSKGDRVWKCRAEYTSERERTEGAGRDGLGRESRPRVCVFLVLLYQQVDPPSLEQYPISRVFYTLLSTITLPCFCCVPVSAQARWLLPCFYKSLFLIALSAISLPKVKASAGKRKTATQTWLCSSDGSIRVYLT